MPVADKMEEETPPVDADVEMSDDDSSSSATTTGTADNDDDTAVDPEKTDKLLLEGVSLKEMGNKQFKEGDLDQAARSYRRGANIVKKLNVHNTGDEQVKTLLLALYTNLSMVSFNQGKYQQSGDVASKALMINSEHVKALYRRALAQRKRGNSDEARQDLQTALAKDPRNTAVRKEMVSLKKELEAARKSQKEALRKAFEGSSFLYDDKEEEEKKRLQREKEKKKKEQEEYKKRKQQWEDECVHRMANNESAISYEEWDEEQKKKREAEEAKEKAELEKKEKERKERDRLRRKQEKEARKKEDSDSDDDELTESELAMMRGYKKTKDGRTTSYFTRELSVDEKAKLGDIAPKKLGGSASATPQRLQPVATTDSAAARPSAWNQAGTWEEKDTTKWCQASLRERLESIDVSTSCNVEVTSVSELTGDASFAIAGGKKRYIFDFHAKLEYSISTIDRDTSIAKGVLCLPDICSTSHDEVEIVFESWKAGPATEHEHMALEARKTLRKAILGHIQLWVKDFNEKF